MENPDLIIFGEIHTSKRHKREQAKAIREHRPEFVLCEGFGDAKPEQLRHYLQIYGIKTLRSLLNIAGLEPEDVGVSDHDHLFNGIRAKIVKRISGLFRDNLESESFASEFDEALLGESPSAYLDVEFSSINPGVMIGAMMNIQMEMMKRFPGKMTNEFRGKFYRAIKLIQAVESVLTEEERLRSRHAGMQKILVAANDVGANLAGCDIDKGNTPRIEGDEMDELLSGNESEMIRQLMEKYEEIRKWMEVKSKEREETMGRHMAHYVKQRKSPNPVIAIVGRNHAEEGSSVHPILQQEKVRYSIALQKDHPVSEEERIKRIKYPLGLFIK